MKFFLKKEREKWDSSRFDCISGIFFRLRVYALYLSVTRLGKNAYFLITFQSMHVDCCDLLLDCAVVMSMRTQYLLCIISIITKENIAHFTHYAIVLMGQSANRVWILLLFCFVFWSIINWLMCAHTPTIIESTNNHNSFVLFYTQSQLLRIAKHPFEQFSFLETLFTMHGNLSRKRKQWRWRRTKVIYFTVWITCVRWQRPTVCGFQAAANELENEQQQQQQTIRFYLLFASAKTHTVTNGRCTPTRCCFGFKVKNQTCLQRFRWLRIVCVSLIFRLLFV